MRLSASAAGHTSRLDIRIRVTNSEETGSLSLSSPQPQADADYTATLSDPDQVSTTTWTWERSTSRNGPWAAVAGASGGVTTSVYTPDTDDVGYYLRVTAAYTDGHGPNKSLVQRSANPVRAARVTNDRPSFGEVMPTRSIAEDAGVNARVGNPVTATDPDSDDVLTYELSGSDLFTIDGSSGQIRVVVDNSLDHETAPSHSVEVKASDTSNAFDTVTVTIIVDDVNEPPSATDDSTNTLEDAAVTIDIVSNDGDPEDERSELTVLVATPPRRGSLMVDAPVNPGDRPTITYTPNKDYNGADSFTYRLRDTGNLTDTALVAINVTAVNDAPMFASSAATRIVSANANPGEDVGASVTATDVDENDMLTYSLSGADASLFEIGRHSGQITVASGVVFDVERKDTYNFMAEVVDTAFSSASIDVTITVTTGPVAPPRGGGGGGGGRPPPAVVAPAIDYTLRVLDNRFVQAPGNIDLQHNIPDLEVTFPDGRVVSADFLGHYRRTGELTRWGYSTSEVLVLEDGTLTQFYQRAVVDFHDIGSGWVVERRLAWDYVGGGDGGSDDQGVEPAITNPHAGTPLGPWGHKVSDFAIDGTDVGFATFFYLLGGTEAFGLPKSDAREDTGAPGTLREPGKTLGFIRQYFQAAVLEFHPNDPESKVKLTLLGDSLRGILVPDFAEHAPFGRAERLVREAKYEPYAVPDPVEPS